MNENNYSKLPRLYIDITLSAQANITLPDEQAHYLRNVMRRKEGENIRLFNAYSGEWLAQIDHISKRTTQVQIIEKLRSTQDETSTKEVHLIFSPIKKERLDFLIEKATELGVTHFHPVIMNNTQLSKIKTERIEKQIISASEQCERLDIAVINEIKPLHNLLSNWPAELHIYAAIERQKDIPHLQSSQKTKYAYIIGPEGGFDESEIELLKSHENVSTVDLGENILRSETAACAGLAILSANSQTN